MCVCDSASDLRVPLAASKRWQIDRSIATHTTTIQVAGILLATVNPCLAPLSRRHTDTRPAAAPTLAAGLPIA